MSTWTRVNLVLALLMMTLFLLDRLADQPAAPNALTALDTQRINTVRVWRGDRLTLHLERSDGAWRLAHPQVAPARPERVAALLAVARAPIVQRLASTTASADYGLADPGAVLQLNGTRIAFGDRDPSLRNRYVSIDDSVAVIDELYFNLLGLPAGHFRED